MANHFNLQLVQPENPNSVMWDLGFGADIQTPNAKDVDSVEINPIGSREKNQTPNI